MSFQDVSLNPKQLLAAINDNLNRNFFAGARHSAKRLFHTLDDGKNVKFMHIDMGDAGEVICELALDTSLYVGKFNFGRFRKSLAIMMLAISKQLQADTKVNALRSEHGEIMFNIPGATEEDGQLNIMVCSFKSLGPGLAIVRLMYLNPEHYVAAAKVEKDSSA